jgi:hypothetical protein
MINFGRYVTSLLCPCLQVQSPQSSFPVWIFSKNLRADYHQVGPICKLQLVNVRIVSLYSANLPKKHLERIRAKKNDPE